MEKRRRARINNCLNELKTLILDATKKDVSIFKELPPTPSHYLSPAPPTSPYYILLTNQLLLPFSSLLAASTSFQAGKGRHIGEDSEASAGAAASTGRHATGCRSQDHQQIQGWLCWLRQWGEPLPWPGARTASSSVAASEQLHQWREDWTASSAAPAGSGTSTISARTGCAALAAVFARTGARNSDSNKWQREQPAASSFLWPNPTECPGLLLAQWHASDPHQVAQRQHCTCLATELAPAAAATVAGTATTAPAAATVGSRRRRSSCCSSSRPTASAAAIAHARLNATAYRQHWISQLPLLCGLWIGAKQQQRQLCPTKSRQLCRLRANGC